ncbi:unnamed protein product, partial [Discosporangium mesarthrocarpum]
EYEFCSRRGLCDLDTGRCTCVQGFAGASCGFVENQVVLDEDVDVLLLHAQSTSFTGKSNICGRKGKKRGRTG